jgi:hypothetical protein
MSITTPDDRISTYNPVVATTQFAAGFPVFDNSDISVFVDGVERFDFTVTATYVQGISNDAKAVFAPGITGAVDVVGTRDPRRSNRFTTGAPLPIPDQNLALDTVEAEVQEAARNIRRAHKAPYGEDGSVFTAEDVSSAQANAEAAAQSAEDAEDSAEEAAAWAALALNQWSRVTFTGDGATTDYPLAANPGSINNVFASFGGINQQKSTMSLVDIIGVTNVRFSSPTPNGVECEILYGNRTTVGTPADGSISTAKIAPNAVTFDKLADIPTNTFLGRQTAGTGDPEVLTAAQAQAVLMPLGGVVDSKTVRYTANASMTAVIPADDTIPQITEGTEIISTTFTMKSTTNILRLRFRGNGANSVAGGLIAAIFIAGDANAKTTGYTTVADVNFEALVDCGIDLVPASLSVLTISVRAGPGGAATTRFNGSPAGRLFGCSMGAVLEIQEIKA